MSMMYRTYRTTMGRRYRMREPYDARMEKILFRVAIVVFPFVTAAGMMLLWIKGA